jgi:starch phosphorylase
MTTHARHSLPAVPASLAGLLDLALDLRWSWSHSADALWERLAPELWEVTGNPLHILQTISRTRLEEAAADPEFLQLLDRHTAARRAALEAPTWFEEAYPNALLGPVAYFSMEFGLSEALPIYSGGLGILAGDFLKAASDLGVPVVGVGLLWQQGYFRQALNMAGEQIEFFPFNDPGQLPIAPLRDSEGELVTITLEFPRRRVRLRTWEVRAGRVRLYLLDANDLMNSPADRGITSDLYGGSPEVRLQQEIILGIGGWRLLRELAVEPEVCHLNEGHAAFAVLERARCHMQDRGVGFAEALTATRAGNLFTTHTPVEAGFDRFPAALVGEYLGAYADGLGIGLEQLLALGRGPWAADEPFNMAYLAINGSGAVNGVSRLHGEVSRTLFQRLFPRWPHPEVPVGHVTNGVHVPSWDSGEADALWTKACGKARWLGGLEGLGDSIRAVGDEELWAFRDANRRKLVAVAREHVQRQGRRPDLSLRPGRSHAGLCPALHQLQAGEPTPARLGPPGAPPLRRPE